MKDQNHRIEFNHADPRNRESRFPSADSTEAAVEEKDFKSLLEKWQVAPSPPSLDQRVMTSYHAQTARPSWWRRMLTASIPVPVPAAAALVVVMVLGAAALTRPLPAPMPQAPTIVERIKTVEVPVVQEKVVQRIVYRARETAMASQAKPLPAPESISLAIGSEENSQSYFTDTNLKGFQPNSEMKLKVIKKADGDEK